MKQLTIIVPVYNEELSIDAFFNEFLVFKHNLKNKNYNADVLFINDGSKDNTSEILISLTQKYDFCTAL